MQISFSKSPVGKSHIGVFFIGDDMKFSQDICDHNFDKDIESLFAFKKYFRGKKGQVVNFVPYGDSPFEEVLLIGLGKKTSLSPLDMQFVGSKLVQYLNTVETKEVSICCNIPKDISFGETEFVDNLYQGVAIRGYKFTKYFARKKEDNKVWLEKVVLCCQNHKAIEAHMTSTKVLMDGVNFARNLVSEPGNVIYPETLMKECKALSKSGLKVTVMDKKDIAKLGMNALLGVAQGSAKDPYVVVIEWHGGNKKESPVAFVGKGVTFDTGGISIKPSHNMSDMKYDMAGAAAVIGTMKVLAERGAKVNAVGVVGLVENMPSGTAQRPGDVVISMSGQSIEVDDTDAEGRLVLADVLWYTQSKYSPKYMVNLATLTGAIVVALGDGAYAGLFSNSDELVQKLVDSGLRSGDKVWRFPMGEHYDKQINSEVADVRNTGVGRGGGSITAAHFLQRFVNECKWAHLDIAGMAWEKNGSDIYPKGATGFGIRLLNNFVATYCES